MSVNLGLSQFREIKIDILKVSADSYSFAGFHKTLNNLQKVYKSNGSETIQVHRKSLLTSLNLNQTLDKNSKIFSPSVVSKSSNRIKLNKILIKTILQEYKYDKIVFLLKILQENKGDFLIASLKPILSLH